VRAIFDSVTIDPADAIDPVGDGRLDPTKWQYVSPSEGTFAALLPGAARRTNGQLPLDAQSYPVAIYAVEDGARRFEVVEVHLGDDAAQSAIDAVCARMSDRGLRERERRDVQLSGFFGRDVSFASDTGEVRSRFYIGGCGAYAESGRRTSGRGGAEGAGDPAHCPAAQHLFELRITAGPGSGETRSADAARFFDSFRIL
jgi:hypothetical protein